MYGKSIPRPSDVSYNSLDFSGLNALKRGVQQGANTTLAHQRKVAQQFESIFIQQMLKASRESSKGLSFDSDQTRMVQSLRDEQLAGMLSTPGLGLAQILFDQIRALQNAGEQATPEQLAARAPEMSNSRLSGLQSSMPEERPNHASSISGLIDMLTSKAAKVVESVQSASRGAPSHVQEFVSRMRNAARHAANETGIHEKLILSQAALESGWGKREIRGEDGSTSYNLFGIKATSSWKGKVVNIMTTEYIDGEPRKMMQPFRAYNSYAESFADYARLISTADRYSDVVTAPTAEEAARRIQSAGYATDPSYADKLISIMGYFKADQVEGAGAAMASLK